MDSSTLHYYSANAMDIFHRYESVKSSLATRFLESFTAGGRVLDIGCGSGRDLAALAALGFDVHGAEPVAEFVERAQIAHPELRGRVLQGCLPDIGLPFGGGFDGVLCSAVLMHLDPSEVFGAALAIKRCLKQGGRLLISVPSKRPDLLPDDRDANGRLFKTYQPGYLQLVFERLGFALISQWSNADSLGRDGVEWVTLLLHLQTGQNSRPIDQIEGILNADRKVATYKFALVRALAEIATQSLNRVFWLDNDKVGLSIGLVAEKWVEYYWPLVESEVFIPQLAGEGTAGANGIKFRASLQALINLYRKAGSYVRYRLERNAGRLSEETRQLEARALADIVSAIWTGPVKYAGGALESGRVFSYDGRRKLVIIPRELWIELSLLGHWISQAVVLRWAEKSVQFGAGLGLTVAQVIPLLLGADDPMRTTVDARNLYGRAGLDECVWTGQRLGRSFEVDHVIPYSLWRNNDLWNLLPATRAANNEKRDRLPHMQLLQRRRDVILGYWDCMRGEAQLRFEREAGTLVQPEVFAANWHDVLFNQLCEAVEVTALQRAVQRWEP